MMELLDTAGTVYGGIGLLTAVVMLIHGLRSGDLNFELVVLSAIFWPVGWVAGIRGFVASGSGRSEAEWDEEDAALKEGNDPPPCPKCGRCGFYAPRWAEPDRKYFACKFCGYWQRVGKPAVQEIIRYECDQCGSANWKESHEDWTCECGKHYKPDNAVPWPNDVPGHPWDSAPEAGTQAEFQRWQESQGYEPVLFGVF